MLMAARSSGGSPQWTRRPLPGARARQTSRDAGPLAAIAGFMAPARRSGERKAAESERVSGSGSDADEEEVGVHAEDDEWEDLARGEEEMEEGLEEEEVVAFRDADFHDDDDSEYAPSEAGDGADTLAESVSELDEEDESVAGLFAAYLPRRRRSSNKLGIARSLVLPPRRSGKSSSDSDEGSFSEQDARLWSSADEKQQWASWYRDKDRAFRRAFGCAIDSQALPEAKRRLQRERSHRLAYVVVILVLVGMYTAQLTGISPASLLSTAFTAEINYSAGSDEGSSDMLSSQRPSTVESNGFGLGDSSVIGRMGEAINHFGVTLEDPGRDVANGEHAAMDRVSSSTYAEEDLSASVDQATPSDYTMAAIDLCGQLLYRVVTSRHDPKVIQNAASACDIATKLSPLGSVRLTVAHAHRGDLRSLLEEFAAADKDYTISALGLLSIASESEAKADADAATLAALQNAVEAKIVANRWIQLYLARDTDALVREVVQAAPASDDAPVSSVGDLAANWLRVFKRDKAVIDALTGLRMWTLRRLDDVAPPSTR